MALTIIAGTIVVMAMADVGAMVATKRFGVLPAMALMVMIAGDWRDCFSGVDLARSAKCFSECPSCVSPTMRVPIDADPVLAQVELDPHLLAHALVDLRVDLFHEEG